MIKTMIKTIIGFALIIASLVLSIKFYEQDLLFVFAFMLYLAGAYIVYKEAIKTREENEYTNL